MIYFLGPDTILDYGNNIQKCDEQFIYDYCNSKTVLGLDTETQRKYPKGRYDETIHKPGLDPYLSRVCMLQIGDEKNQFIIDTRHRSIDFLKPILESNSILKILHNSKFDAKHLIISHNIYLKNTWDTMLCERILYNGERLSYSLESLMKRHLGYENKLEVDLFNNIEEELEVYDYLNDIELIDYVEKKYVDKSIRANFVEIGDRYFNEDEILYGATDVTAPVQLYNIQKEGREINGELYKPDKAFDLENKYALVLAKMELRGIKLDSKGWSELCSENKIKLQEKLIVLNNYVINNFPEWVEAPNLFNFEKRCILDWNSSTEMVKFFKKLNHCPQERSKVTKKIEYTVGASSMFKLLTNENKDRFFSLADAEITDTQSLILNYLIMKKYTMLTTTFGDMFLKHVHPKTGRIHTNFIQLQNTARISSVNPNIQNQPNTKNFRSKYICENGNKLIAIDFSAQELRYLSTFANIKNMKDFFINGDPIHGDDMHSYSATNAFRIIRKDPELLVTKKTHPKERNIMKALTFGINYGKQAFSVAQELGIDEVEAQTYIDGFLDAYPGLRENFNERKKLVLKKGWIELDPVTKRRYFFPDFKKMKEYFDEAISYYGEDYKELNKEEREIRKKQIKEDNPNVSILWREWSILKGKLERAALNFPIQGGSASMSKIASLYIDSHFPDLKEGLLIAVHDEMVIEVLEEKSEEMSLRAQECFLESGKNFSKDVLFTSESAIGDYWIH